LILAAVLVAGVALAAAAQEVWFQRDTECRSGVCPPAFAMADQEGFVILSDRNAWLGVHLAEVTKEKMAELKLKEEYGALVTEVEPDSPAAKAGLQKNDVILEYQGERVDSAAKLGRLVRETPEGRTVRLVVSRDGRPQTLSATLERRQILRREIRIPEIRIPDIHVEVFGARPRLGISADELTPQLAEYFGVKQGKGVLVKEVSAGSPAEKAGVKAGDVIVRADGQAIETVSDLRQALRKKKGGEKVTLTLIRQKAETTVQVELEETPRRGREYSADFLLDPTETNEIGEAMREVQRKMQEVQRSLQRTLQQELQHRLQRELHEKQRELQENLRRAREELKWKVVV
jgi:predicted metalloprotease with PDZ domain